MNAEREKAADFDRRLSDRMAKLKTRGGKGESGVGIIGGRPVTIAESIAKTIAKSILIDAARGEGKEFHEIPLIALAKYAKGRAEGRPVTDAMILQEVGRLLNQATYGDGERSR